MRGSSANISANISAISAASFKFIAKRPHLRQQIFSLSMYEINQALKEPPPDPEAELPKIIPPEYHDFLPLFKKALADKLPPHRDYDHRIPLKEDFTPPFGPLYSLSQNELKALREWLDENLSKGFIRASSSPAGAPILFVKKKDGSLRLCVDYRALNEGTIKDRYPLPLVKDTLNQLSQAKIYTTLDIRGAYNLVRMAEGEEWKTAFRTRYGLFESLVMPFGLTNAPAAFQKFINDVLRPFLDRFCTAYLDDILIYSNNIEEHRSHVKQVLEALSAVGLHLKPEKCEFHRDQVNYLGMVISSKGVSMDPRKVDAVTKWESPQNVTDVRAFIGFANFYRRFIKDYSKVVSPMIRLTGKNIKFQWSTACEASFQQLKTAFTTAPILRHFDYDKPSVLETDASDYVSAGILSQEDENGILHPVAFYSKKHSPAECNYEIYDKEMLAIIRCLEEWRAELEAAPIPVLILTDHRNLEYFYQKQNLNCRQARWSVFLSRFNFKIDYRPGKAGGKPDALTRRSRDLPKEGDERLQHQSQVLIKPHNLQISATASRDTDLDTLFATAYKADPKPKQILQQLQTGVQCSKHISLAHCSEIDGKLLYNDRVYVPAYSPLILCLIQQNHDSPAAGHPGRSKTIELLQRQYYWPNLQKDVERYIRNCHPCQRSRTSRHAPYSILRPLPVPHRAWEDVSMDFVVGLPWSDGFNAILVVTCRLTKMRHLISCRDTTTAKDLARLYIDNVFRLHGLPKSITSDRGSQFVFAFWKALCDSCKIEARFSTPFHPQTDGQTERFNAVMEQYLRCYVNYLQDDWAKWLSLAEFSANNQASETLGMSPFFANYGFDPTWQFDPINASPRGPLQDQYTTAELAKHMQQITEHLRLEINRAQLRHEEAANRRRAPAPPFKIGDLVWFNAQNIKTARPSRKLDYRRQGPFAIVKVVSPHAYELDFPDTMKIHRVQNVSLLDPASDDPLPGQVIPPPPPIIVDGEPEYHVEEILDSRLTRNKLEYLVKWIGYPRSEWQPAELYNQTEAVDIFHAQYPHKPGPLPEDND